MCHVAAATVVRLLHQNWRSFHAYLKVELAILSNPSPASFHVSKPVLKAGLLSINSSQHRTVSQMLLLHLPEQTYQKYS